MAGKLFVLLGFALIAIASAGIARRDAPNEPNSVKELFDNVEKNLKEVEKEFLKLFNVENREQLEQKAKEQSKVIASDFDKLLEKIKSETEAFKDSQLVKDLRADAEKVVSDVKSKHPQTAAELENINSGLTKLVEKTKALADSNEAHNIKQAGENLLKETGAALQKIADEAKNALAANKQ